MIALEHVSIAQGKFSLRDISFTIPQGTYTVLMGSTGCGKTTVLEAIAGLRPIAAGRIQLRGQDVTHLSPAERGLGYVPQENALFATRTVRRQLAFALELRRWSAAAIDARVNELATSLGISHLLDRRPKGLSGGEAKRVALGRALAAKQDLLLLDEPLTGLDQDTHVRLLDLLAALTDEGVTVLHVTHDRQDAARLAQMRLRVEADRIVIEG